jgi:L-asparaginase
MNPAIWVTLARRVAHHLARPDVAGVVITHGTDTLEETAIFLELALAHRCDHRPVVLTAAMRPATSSQADGPQNLADAVAVARGSMSRGILAVMAGVVWRGEDVRKVHGHRLDAFSGGDAAPWARVDAGVPVPLKPTSAPELNAAERWGQSHPPVNLAHLPTRSEDWPWVEIVTSHAGASDRGVKAWVAAGVRGLVVAGTGNGTVHHALLEALQAAQRSGVVVWRSTRCVAGGWVADEAQSSPAEHAWASSGGALTPAQARVALQWQLLTQA